MPYNTNQIMISLITSMWQRDPVKRPKAKSSFDSFKIDFNLLNIIFY
jgi:hypothetical protein